jgi:hypothetical protein
LSLGFAEAPGAVPRRKYARRSFRQRELLLEEGMAAFAIEKATS